MNSEEILNLLKELKQNHIIEKFKNVSEKERIDFISQWNQLDKVCRGGIKEYLQRAKILLEKSKNKISDLNDCKIEVPTDIPYIKIGSELYYEIEKLGFDNIKDSVFVLVAGGLGERLGFPDIKISIPTDIITLRSFIEVYINFIKAYEDKIKKVQNLPNNWFIPFCIMTSGDTHDKTVSFLKENSYFGMKEEQISFVKQDKIPAILDNDCNLALKKDKFLLETKPHGHGDIHYLMYKSEKVNQWVKEEKKFMVQFMDTNILAFNCIPASIGACIKYEFDINSIVVPRRPKDAIGAICKIIKKDGTFVVQNIEYNYLDPLFKEKYNGKGDIENNEGYCDFPGNLNVLIFKLDTYQNILKESKGLVPEFVNPKYSDETRTKFKSPTRLECLMQDVPKLVKGKEKVGYTCFDRWFCFSACKNTLHESIEKLKRNESGESAFTVERDIFNFNEKIMKDILGKLEIIKKEPPNEIILENYHLKFGPKIIIYPSFSPTLNELKSKLNNMKKGIKITNNSTLILKNDIEIKEGIILDGFEIIEQNENNLVDVKNNRNIMYRLLRNDEGKIYEQLRGYCIDTMNK